MIVAALTGNAAASTLYAADNLTDGSANGVFTLDAMSLTPFAAFGMGGVVSGVAASQAYVFVSLTGGVAKVTTSGVFVGGYGASALDRFAALSLAGGVLYAADNLSDGSAFGVIMLDPANMTPLGVLGMSSAIGGVAADGTNVFVSLAGGIAKLSMTGAFLGAYPSIGFDHFGALSLSGGVLYAANNLTDESGDGVVKLDPTTMQPLGFFGLPGDIGGLVVDANYAYVSLPTGIAKLTTGGAFVAGYGASSLDDFGALAVAPVPEPSTWALTLAGFGALAAFGWRASRRTAPAAG